MSRHYLITGGAGFIGSNYVDRLISRGEKVTIYDNLSRPGAQINMEWLRNSKGEQAFNFIRGDIREFDKLTQAVQDADVVVHLAAQVAVTTSVSKPREDFDINAQGTFNVLEAVRNSRKKPIMIYASTNKVYGGMDDAVIVEKEGRYEYQDLRFGASEAQPLDFHSPYGCSKGAGDQYVRDYHRIYGVKSVVFRQSCIYGPRQFGIEDQGWVAWFAIAAVTGRPIKIYGDGKQVRDILYVEDLLNAYDAAIERIDSAAGQVFNVGGGSENTISIWNEFGPMLEKLTKSTLSITKGEWRPGDQKVYVSDIRKAADILNWKPNIKVDEGVTRLVNWVRANQKLF